MAKPAIVLSSSLNAAESKSGLAIAANPDFQGAPPKRTTLRKRQKSRVLENPEPQDLTYPAPPSSTFAGADSDYQSFLPHGIISCGANNIRVEGTNSGNNADYATLKGAFDAINAGTHTGAIIIGVCGDTTETAPAVLNASGTGSASYTSVLMVPNGAHTISGAIVAGSPLIDLNGADNVTINGLSCGLAHHFQHHRFGDCRHEHDPPDQRRAKQYHRSVHGAGFVHIEHDHCRRQHFDQHLDRRNKQQ